MFLHVPDRLDLDPLGTTTESASSSPGDNAGQRPTQRQSSHLRSSSLPAVAHPRGHIRSTSLAVQSNRPLSETDEPPHPEPFDFNMFLEQLRSKSASPIARYIKR